MAISNISIYQKPPNHKKQEMWRDKKNSNSFVQLPKKTLMKRSLETAKICQTTKYYKRHKFTFSARLYQLLQFQSFPAVQIGFIGCIESR